MRENAVVTQEPKKNLTQYELEGLSQVYNLADGHAHQRQNFEQAKIVAQLPEIFQYVERNTQLAIENDFLTSFFGLAHQQGALGHLKNSLLCYSASIATEIVANLIKQRNLRIALIEPTFDNIASILLRVGVEVISVEETILFPTPDLELLASLPFDALFLVMPNNPTGRFLRKENFERIVGFCTKYHKLLIADYCFRFFEPEMFYDQYELAINAGIDFIYIEDTGKTWPSLDLKVSVLSVSDSLLADTFQIHNDFLLNVSPFSLELLKRYIDASANKDDLLVRGIILANREYLRGKLRASILRPMNLESRISVEWVEITNGFKATHLVRLLKEHGVFVLPGTHFYWHNPCVGEKYLRIALMRDITLFQAAAEKLASSLLNVEGVLN